MIERIRIRNYRSLHNVDVKLEPLTVLIGRSGSGKSNFVRAVRRLRDIVSGHNSPQDTSTIHPFGGGDAGLAYEIDGNVKGFGGFSYSVEFAKTDNPHAVGALIEEQLVAMGRKVYHQIKGKWAQEPAVTPKPNPRELVLGKLTGVREATVVFVAITRGIGCYDFPGTVLQDNSPLDRAPKYEGVSDSHLTVASRILDAIERLSDWNDIGKSMTALNPRLNTIDLLLPARDQLRVGYQVTAERSHLVDVSQESEGFRRYLAHLLALYQTPPKQTMIFEHPEHGIHPGALEALSEEFTTHVEDGRGQVILTTHSPQLLDHFEPQQLRVVTMDGDQTRIGPLAADQLDVIRKGLMTPGDLLTVEEPRTEAAEEVGV